jgi:hypothetical protein
VLLDIGSIIGGIGLAVVGFIVVILVCVVILRLLAAILPSYEDRTPLDAAGGDGPVAVDTPSDEDETAVVAPVPNDDPADVPHAGDPAD